MKLIISLFKYSVALPIYALYLMLFRADVVAKLDFDAQFGIMLSAVTIIPTTLLVGLIWMFFKTY